ncbi:MAG: hypothetical protein WD342_04385 [Verrucomicrobiales bacterium]
MKNITLSADERLIEEAREAARGRKTTLNQLFREWLAEIAGREERQRRVSELLERLHYTDAGGKFSRDEMNER